LNEETTFRVLASDDAFVGRFIWLFGQRDELFNSHYDGSNETIRKADACASLLKTYGLSNYETNYREVDIDIYVDATLTEKGKRFRSFLYNWLLPKSKVDYSAEKLIHSLMMFVPLRSRLWDGLDQKDKDTLTYAIEDLAKAVINHSLSNSVVVDFSLHWEQAKTFVKIIQNARSRADVIAAFAAIKETQPFWCMPYFDSSDIQVLNAARHKIQENIHPSQITDVK
jgi:hypothetical protein